MVGDSTSLCIRLLDGVLFSIFFKSQSVGRVFGGNGSLLLSARRQNVEALRVRSAKRKKEAHAAPKSDADYNEVRVTRGTIPPMCWLCTRYTRRHRQADAYIGICQVAKGPRAPCSSKVPKPKIIYTLFAASHRPKSLEAR